MILSLLIATEKEGRYFKYSEVDSIVDTTTERISSNYQSKIDRLNVQILKIQSINSNIDNSYKNEISLLKQKHDFEMQSLRIKMKLNHNKYLFGGLAIGIAGTVLISSIQSPLFSIKF